MPNFNNIDKFLINNLLIKINKILIGLNVFKKAKMIFKLILNLNKEIWTIHTSQCSKGFTKRDILYVVYLLKIIIVN